MKSFRNHWTRRFALVFPLLTAAPMFAQGYLSTVEINKKVVSDFYRLVLEPRNVDLIEQFVSDEFIDHDQQDQKGTSGVMKTLKALGPAANDDISSTLRNPPAYIMAQADLVTYIFKNGNTLTLDVYRIKSRKLVEHWTGTAKVP